MAWLRGIFAGRNPIPPHSGGNSAADERVSRLRSLSDGERTAYRYLFEGYSEAWTAETLGLERRDAKKLFSRLYRKLGVASSREIILHYAPDGARFHRTQGDARESSARSR